MAIDDILYPLCKFDYDFMYLVLLIAPMIVVVLIAYNGMKVMSGSEETRIKGKHGIKNALLGLLLVFAFAAIGSMLVPECMPFPGKVYSFSLASPAVLGEFNVWITSPNNADLFAVNTAITFDATTRGGEGTVLCSWNFNDKGTVSSWGSCSGVTHTYAKPGDYKVEVSARDGANRVVVHRIMVRVQK